MDNVEWRMMDISLREILFLGQLGVTRFICNEILYLKYNILSDIK